MYYYPVTSAIVGTLLNFNVLALVVLLSWLRFFAPPSYREEQEDDEEEIEELDGSLKSGSTSIKEGMDDENDGSESRRSSDLEVLNNDIVFQLDSEEDPLAKNFENKEEDKKTI